MNLRFIILLIALPVSAANWYVDNAAVGSNNGTSWANAWQSPTNIVWASVAAGDTVYISGGSTAKAYNEGMDVVKKGLSGSPVTIRVGQDSGHNGTVLFTNQMVTITDSGWVTLDGEVSGARKMTISATNGQLCSLQLNNSTNAINVRYLNLVSNVGSAYVIRWDQARASKNLTNAGEVAYCYFEGNYGDPVSTVDGGVENKWGAYSIHHNVITNNGGNGLVLVTGANVYDNTIVDPSQTLNAGEHKDGIEPYGGYFRIERNLIRNFNVSGIMLAPGEPQSTTYNNMLVVNNLIIATQTNSPSQRGIQLYWTPVGGGTPTDKNLTITNFVVANNTIVGIPYYALYMRVREDTYTNVVAQDLRIQNNIIKDCVNMDLAVNLGGLTDMSGFQFSNNNISGSVQKKIGWFDSNYDTAELLNAGQGLTGNTSATVTMESNYSLAAADTGAKNLGANLSAYFTTDFAGNIRSVPWDIGAYEYGAGGGGGGTGTNTVVRAPVRIKGKARFK